MDCIGATDTGRRRKDNQDNFYFGILANDNRGFCVICDGMGGAKSGNVASDMTLSIFCAEVKKRVLPKMSLSYMKAIMTEAIRAANSYTFKKSQEDERFSGMGSTIVAVLTSNLDACVMNVGDSRAYLLSDQTIRQITTDHSVAQEMVRRGELTAEEALTHPSRNYITRAVGTECSVDPQFYDLKLKPDDILLLCSDGLYNTVKDQQILHIVSSGSPLSSCAHDLIQRANDNGGPDNITVTIMKV